MPSLTADKHFAPQQRGKSFSVSRLRNSSRFIFPQAGGDIKLQQWQKQHPNTPLPAGFPSPLSAVSSKCLLPVRPELSTQSVCLHNYHHAFSKVRNEILHHEYKSKNVYSATLTTEILLMHLPSVILTYCILTLDRPLVSSLFLSQAIQVPKNVF